MNTFAVVEQFDVIEDRRPGLVTGVKVAVMNEFILQGREETLSHRVVLWHFAPIHALPQPVRLEQSSVRRRAVLRPAIGVMDQSRLRSALRQGHLQRPQAQHLSGPLIHRPAHHLVREQIEQDGKVQPALARANEGHVPGPDAVRRWRCETTQHQVRGGCRRLVMLDRDALALLTPRLDARFAAQPGDTMLAAGNTALVERTPGLHPAVGLPVLNVHAPDVDQQPLISQGTLARRTTEPGCARLPAPGTTSPQGTACDARG